MDFPYSTMGHILKGMTSKSEIHIALRAHLLSGIGNIYLKIQRTYTSLDAGWTV